MKIRKLISIATLTVAPTIALAAGPTPPAPGDLPSTVLTNDQGGLVELGDGRYYATTSDGYTVYGRSDGTTVPCSGNSEIMAGCRDALMEDENPPAGDPPAEDPPAEEPPKGGGIFAKIFKKKD